MSKIIPNSSYTPNIYLDKVMHLLTSDEWKVLSYACRRIFGFHKEGYTDRISNSQFTSGTRNSEGDVLDSGTGLNHGTVSKVVTSLCEYGVMIRVAENNIKNEGIKYSLQLDDNRINFFGLQQRKDAKSRGHTLRLSAIQTNKDESSVIPHCGEGLSTPQSTPTLQCGNTKESRNKVEIKTLANDENPTENQHTDENESIVDLPVLLSQTGAETEQDDSPISIEETSNTQQSTVEHENSGLESDHRDHQTRNHSAPRKKSARRAVPAQSAMLPASDTIAAAEPKTRKRSVATAVKKEPEHTPEQRYRMAEYVAIFEDERNKPYVPKSSLAGRIWKEVKELLLYNPSLEDVRNMYRSYAAQPFWAGRNITPITLANNYEEWVTAKRPMNGATRYRDPANVPVQKPRQTDPNVIDASSLFWIENDKRFDLEPNDLVF